MCYKRDAAIFISNTLYVLDFFGAVRDNDIDCALAILHKISIRINRMLDGVQCREDKEAEYLLEVYLLLCSKVADFSSIEKPYNQLESICTAYTRANNI